MLLRYTLIKIFILCIRRAIRAMSVAEPGLSGQKESKPFAFSSTQGKNLISTIITRYVSHPAHDYVLEGVAKALDGRDVFAMTPTGSGKTGYIAFTALVVKELKQHPERYPEAAAIAKKFPHDPLMLSICPTNYIEYQQEQKLLAMGLKGLIINSETIQEVKESKKTDLWVQAQEDPTISLLIMSPEQLTSKYYETALKNSKFRDRIYALTVDEVHLLLTWGKSFRKPFRQIGLARSRLSDDVFLICLTATMRSNALNTVCLFLGLKEGEYHSIKRSNQRHDIQLIVREISSPADGTRFRELDWVLERKRNTIVFCRTIRLGAQVLGYFHHKDKQMGGDPRTVLQRLRQYDSLSKEYNEVTRNLMRSQMCQVVIATSTLAVGIDLEGIEDVVIYGDPEDLDQMVQMIGKIRPEYRESAVTRQGIVYFSANARKRAEESLAKHRMMTTLDDKPSIMDLGLAQFYLAQCKVEDLDRQYENSDSDVQCSCKTCIEIPPPSAHVPCLCSGCSPETISTASSPSKPVNTASGLALPAKHKRLTKPMRVHGAPRS
ncbi:P-loop containing nucleoside triphosphate hydrolase protein [Lentinula guzmanii]|uniref:DNA 3'-5' helicase n=1 Tax=Lentinula guzmanii TaxID=2804957 RepID=A0AA38J8T7_9AGAR|nr:P-loop containing nucleoside triphosphate hydrolase protein [Lentinula guzmanii]